MTKLAVEIENNDLFTTQDAKGYATGQSIYVPLYAILLMKKDGIEL